ncbi:uncharacterized protein LOC144429546 [Styela clava]
MKVILAGYPKTGTKTLTSAFRSVGYTVYDYEEHFHYHGRKWIKIFQTGATSEDFHEMYKDVDVVSDLPSCYFWEDIAQAFPDAKIILMLRDEEEWCTSLHKQMLALKGFVYTWINLLSPTSLLHLHFQNQMGINCFGGEGIFPWTKVVSRPLLEKLAFRKHNCGVIRNASKDKLLIYSVKEGWEPLCRFLGIEVPDIPFPHENKEGKIAEKIVSSGTSPTFQRVKTEIFLSLTLLVAITGVA